MAFPLLNSWHFPHLGENLGLLLQVQECLLVVTWNDLSLRRALELLQTLCASEPRGVVSC